MGDYCGIDEKNQEFNGYTWVHGNQIQYGGGNNARKPSFLFNWTSTPYYMDQKEGENDRIFIKDRESKKRCYFLNNRKLLMITLFMPQLAFMCRPISMLRYITY